MNRVEQALDRHKGKFAREVSWETYYQLDPDLTIDQSTYETWFDMVEDNKSLGMSERDSLFRILGESPEDYNCKPLYMKVVAKAFMDNMAGAISDD